MALLMNQFAMTTTEGTLVSGDSLTCEFYDASAATVVAPGEFVAIKATPSGQVTLVGKGADTAADYFGPVLTNPLKSAYAVGEKLEVARLGSIVLLKAGEAITAGARLMYDPSTSKVMVKTTGKTIVAIALEDGVTDSLVRAAIQGF